MKLSRLLLVPFFGLSANALAAETWFTLPMISYHYDRDAGYNEVHPGLGIEHGNAQVRFVGGVYKNSRSKSALYGGLLWLPLAYGRLRAGVVGGLVTGYETPIMGAFTLAYEGPKVGAALMAIPHREGMVALQLKWRLE